MLEIITPLNSVSFAAEGLALREAPDFTLTLYAGSANNLRRETGYLPDMGLAEKHRKNTFFRIGPEQVLVIGPEFDTRLCAATPLSSGRVRIEISGPKARALLAACAAIDFSAEAFGQNAYAQTGIHHMPVLIHALADDTYHIYGLRTFAQSLWHWLVDAAEGLR